jgi:putative ABC transport system permease protein
MLRGYIKISIRNLLKRKGYTLINIAGLAIGMAVFMIIALYVYFERSYEDFIPDSENIYRLSLEHYVNGELQFASAENYPAAGPALKSELPEVLEYARLYNLGYKNNVIITNEAARPEPIAYKQKRFLYADASFLPLMGYEMARGNAADALKEPNTAVISEQYARLYFGEEENPIGQHLHMQDDDFNDELVEVRGVFKDLPANTHLKFDVLFSYKTLFSRGERAPARYDQSWQRNDMYTFLKLRPDADPEAVSAKLPAIIDKYNPDQAAENRKNVMSLQALADIHLNSDLTDEAESNGDGRVVLFMSLIGLFVLIIAWINYVNLSTARSLERAREVGVRKVSGAEKSQLIGQFLVEAALVNAVAILLAVSLLILALPKFNDLTGLQFTTANLTAGWFLALLPLLWLIGTALSGFYPALVLSSFRPATVLKGTLKNTKKGVLLRKSLVVVQFTASVVLIAGTIIVYRQLNYMLKRDIGMNIDQVLVLERPGIAQRDREAFDSAIDVFRAELAKSTDVEAVSTSFTVPGKQREYLVGAKPYGAGDDAVVSLRFNSMDYNFLDVFKMKLLAGRNFSPDFPRDSDTSVIITESAVPMLGYETPEDIIGRTITLPDFPWDPIVVGVVNDYHQVSLKQAVDPSVFYHTRYSGEFYSLRLQTDNLDQTLGQVQQAWNTAFPGNPFDYFFLDDFFNRQYQNERRFGSLAGVFALLAILVGCLGLFGLSGYMITQRTKEIGIRKVLGASTPGLVGLLSKDLLKLVLIAFVLAIPLTWWTMNQWLENFAYRIQVEWWVFALAGGMVIALAFLTMSFQSIKAALSNPVRALKSE